MGGTAEKLARKWDISRESQDALAAESHRRALDAIASGKFTDQIVPIELKTKCGTIQFATDESPRTDASIQNLTKLKPVFEKAGTVTAGNSSSINDGAAAVGMMNREAT